MLRNWAMRVAHSGKVLATQAWAPREENLLPTAVLSLRLCTVRRHAHSSNVRNLATEQAGRMRWATGPLSWQVHHGFRSMCAAAWFQELRRTFCPGVGGAWTYSRSLNSRSSFSVYVFCKVICLRELKCSSLALAVIQTSMRKTLLLECFNVVYGIWRIDF